MQSNWFHFEQAVTDHLKLHKSITKVLHHVVGQTTQTNLHLFSFIIPFSHIRNIHIKHRDKNVPLPHTSPNLVIVYDVCVDEGLRLGSWSNLMVKVT